MERSWDAALEVGVSELERPLVVRVNCRDSLGTKSSHSSRNDVHTDFGMGCEAFDPRDCYFPCGSLHSRALISLDRRRYSCGQSSSQCFTSSPFDHASHFKWRIFSTTCDGRACICEGFASAYMKIVRHLFQYLRLPLIHPYSMTLQLLPKFLQESGGMFEC